MCRSFGGYERPLSATVLLGGVPMPYPGGCLLSEHLCFWRGSHQAAMQALYLFTSVSPTRLSSWRTGIVFLLFLAPGTEVVPVNKCLWD